MIVLDAAVPQRTWCLATVNLNSSQPSRSVSLHTAQCYMSDPAVSNLIAKFGTGGARTEVKDLQL